MGLVLRFSEFYKKIYELVNINKEIGNIISLEFNETIDFQHGGFIMGNWRNKT